MRFIFCSFIVLAITVPLESQAQDPWNLKRDRDGIQVYTSDVDGSPHEAVKAVTIVENVRLASMVALIEDAEACPDWADRCAESYLIERLSETESYVYTRNNMPFPVKDRDVIAHVKWSQDPSTFDVTMHSVATEGILEEQRGRLRLTNAQARWVFKPLASGGVEITSEAHIDPGSNLPGWVTNMLLVDTPFETLKAFVAEARKPKYQNSVVEFIKEP